MEESSGESGDDDEANVEAFEHEQREKLEQEKQAILNNKELIAEVRGRLKYLEIFEKREVEKSWEG